MQLWQPTIATQYHLDKKDCQKRNYIPNNHTDQVEAHIDYREFFHRRRVNSRHVVYLASKGAPCIWHLDRAAEKMNTEK